MDGGRGYLLHEALKRVMSPASSRGNEFVQVESAVGAGEKAGRANGELESVLAAIVRQLARHAIHLAPFMPEQRAVSCGVNSAGRGDVAAQRFAERRQLNVTGWQVRKGLRYSRNHRRRSARSYEFYNSATAECTSPRNHAEETV